MCLRVIVVTVFFLFFLTGCIQTIEKRKDITMVCVRDMDTLHLRINNNTADTLYVPRQYIGTYNTGNDTIFLETVNKPRFSKDYLYIYKRVFPFEVYLTKKLHGVQPDSTVVVEKPIYYFNQFLVDPFTVILPNSTFTTSAVFYVPPGANSCSIVYYNTPFFLKNKKPITANYFLEDWLKFDSVYAKHVTGEIADRVY